MSEKQVSIARHGFFFKMFFTKHKEFLEELIKISYNSLDSGYLKLNVFYSSYSYYLKEDNKDNYLKDLIKEKRDEFKKDNVYRELSNKVNINGIGSLTYTELNELNILYHKYLKATLEIFEIYNYRFAPSDLFPKITSNIKEHDRDIVYIVYDTFYESLFNIHAKVHEKLMSFNIVEFQEMFKVLMVFFYGYSYYLQKDTIKEIKDDFNVLFDYYNNQEFLRAYFNLLQGDISKGNITMINDYQNKMLDSCLNIFEKINGDLPKSNLFPKRAERVVVDTTLI